ncbi:hypothetical protein [Polyangium mundeleinium]|uniref:Outer membrane protein beta-barrel domain-containing protein n=1 Tax=Polyangium mundeleinium TaxID=2995306 RepID=A0ABT5F7A1_9BACT|nr:hypothetical protein [Polyangium mundeleinium]MDC0749970.1 hypothetical protein [Polyangium mundeleinium]
MYDLVFPGCLFMQIGQVAVGVDGKQLPDYTDVLVGVGARVGLERFFFGPLGAHIELDATYYLSDVVLRLDGAEVWRLPDVSFAVRVGLDGLFDVF